ncbi:hypothetical protein INR49_024818 [Caranx melampygus]|nr:hypothetical protein INR49_024818 [Caranx melampygus]
MNTPVTFRQSQSPSIGLTSLFIKTELASLDQMKDSSLNYKFNCTQDLFHNYVISQPPTTHPQKLTEASKTRGEKLHLDRGNAPGHAAKSTEAQPNMTHHHTTPHHTSTVVLPLTQLTYNGMCFDWCSEGKLGIVWTGSRLRSADGSDGQRPTWLQLAIVHNRLYSLMVVQHVLHFRARYDGYSGIIQMKGELSVFLLVPSVQWLVGSSQGSSSETVCLLWSHEPGQRGYITISNYW